MLILLPPSESKRPTGSGSAWDPDAAALPSLGPTRRSVVDALVALSEDPAAAMRALKISERQRDDVERNRELPTAPTMPAIDRYTGVLFDALDAGSLDPASRAWLGENVMIHSAPFGPVSALDGIPNYRLSAGSRLPGLPPLRRVWSEPVARAIGEFAPEFVLDLRSEAYAALGPVPDTVPSVYGRVVSEGDGGVVRALNHFNKHAKGALVRRLATDRPDIGSLADFSAWAARSGVRTGTERAGEIQLFA